MSKYIDAEKLITEIKRRFFEDYNGPDKHDNEIAQGVCAGILSFIDSLQQEQQEVVERLRLLPWPEALGMAARYVYESWMGGTMDNVRRDMVELGKVLNARKGEQI